MHVQQGIERERKSRNSNRKGINSHLRRVTKRKQAKKCNEQANKSASFLFPAVVLKLKRMQGGALF